MLKNIFEKMNLVMFTCMAFVTPVWAKIPESDDFAKGSDNKGGFETLFWLGEKAVQIIIIAIAVAFVFQLAKAAYQKYGDITDGKATWMELGGHVIGGIALLSLAIIMLNWVGTWVK